MLMDPKIYRKKFDLYSKENKNTLKKKKKKTVSRIMAYSVL